MPETLEIFADRLFDGTAWQTHVVLRVAGGVVASIEGAREPGSLRRADWVLPALVDTHARVYGYSEVPGEDPLAPEGHALDMCTEYGVGYVIDVELDNARISRLRRAGDPASRPVLFGAGPCLSRCGRSRFDLPVGAPGEQPLGDADSAVLTARVSASSFPAISVCSCSEDVLEGDWYGADRAFVRPCEPVRLARWVLRGGDTLWCCGRERLAVSSVEGLMSARNAGLAAGVLPFTAQLPGVSSRASLLVAKRLGRKYMPPWLPERVETADLAAADETIRTTACVVGTGMSQPGAVPGHNAWVEMAHLERCGKPLDQVLSAATGTAGRLLPETSGAGVIRPGLPARWLEGVGTPDSVQSIRAGVRRIESTAADSREVVRS